MRATPSLQPPASCLPCSCLVQTPHVCSLHSASTRLPSLPHTTLPLRSATDHTVYGKGAERCPADGYCTNCMPLKVERGVWVVGGGE